MKNIIDLYAKVIAEQAGVEDNIAHALYRGKPTDQLYNPSEEDLAAAKASEANVHEYTAVTYRIFQEETLGDGLVNDTIRRIEVDEYISNDFEAAVDHVFILALKHGVDDYNTTDGEITFEGTTADLFTYNEVNYNNKATYVDKFKPATAVEIDKYQNENAPLYTGYIVVNFLKDGKEFQLDKYEADVIEMAVQARNNESDLLPSF